MQDFFSFLTKEVPEICFDRCIELKHRLQYNRATFRLFSPVKPDSETQKGLETIMTTRIELVREVTEELQTALNRLLPQLSGSPRPVNLETLSHLVASPHCNPLFIQDLGDINSADAPVNLRVCKGIYIEPANIAYKKYEEVNAHFLEDIELMFQENMYPAIATHDVPLVEGSYKLIEKYKVPKDKYEFQMLYGVTPALRKSIIDKGHRMRVYVPFGKQWFGYSTRRLKENPAMVSHILKAMLGRG